MSIVERNKVMEKMCLKFEIQKRTNILPDTDIENGGFRGLLGIE